MIFHFFIFLLIFPSRHLLSLLHSRHVQPGKYSVNIISVHLNSLYNTHPVYTLSIPECTLRTHPVRISEGNLVSVN